MLTPSSGEAIVGRGVVGRYAGASLGDDLEFGRARWHVVGIFDANGSSFESEVWVDVRELANDAKRPFPYSGVRIRVAPLRMHSVSVRSALACTSSTVKPLFSAATCFIGLILRTVSGGARSRMRDLSRWICVSINPLQASRPPAS